MPDPTPDLDPPRRDWIEKDPTGVRFARAEEIRVQIRQGSFGTRAAR